MATQETAFTAVKYFRRMPIWLTHYVGKANAHFWRGHSKGLVIVSDINVKAILPGRWRAEARFMRMNPYLVAMSRQAESCYKLYKRARFDVFEDWDYDGYPEWLCWLRDEALWIINKLLGKRMEERERRRR